MRHRKLETFRLLLAVLAVLAIAIFAMHKMHRCQQYYGAGALELPHE